MIEDETDTPMLFAFLVWTFVSNFVSYAVFMLVYGFFYPVQIDYALIGIFAFVGAALSTLIIKRVIK